MPSTMFRSALFSSLHGQKGLQGLFHPSRGNDESSRDKSGPLFQAQRPKRMALMNAFRNMTAGPTVHQTKQTFRVFKPQHDKPLDQDAIFQTEPERLLNWLATVVKQPQNAWYETQKIKSLKSSEGQGWRVIVFVREGNAAPSAAMNSRTSSKASFSIAGARSVMQMGVAKFNGGGAKNTFSKFKNRLMSFSVESERPVAQTEENREASTSAAPQAWVAPAKKEEIRFDAEVISMGKGRFGVDFRRAHGEVWYFLRLRREILAAVAKLVSEYSTKRVDPAPLIHIPSTTSMDIGLDSPLTAGPIASPMFPQSISTPSVSSLSNTDILARTQVHNSESALSAIPGDSEQRPTSQLYKPPPQSQSSFSRGPMSGLPRVMGSRSRSAGGPLVSYYQSLATSSGVGGNGGSSHRRQSSQHVPEVERASLMVAENSTVAEAREGSEILTSSLRVPGQHGGV